MATIVLVCSACALTACSNNNDNTTDSRLSALHAENGKILNSENVEIALRGTNLGGWLVQEDWMCPTDQKDYLSTFKTLYSRFGAEKAEELIDVYEDNWISDADFSNIAALGLNVVRIPFTYMNLYKTLDDNGNPLSPADYTLRADAFERLDYAIEQCAKNKLYVILDLHGAAGSQNAKDHSGDTSDVKLFDDDEYGELCRVNTVNLWTEVAKRYKGNTTVAAFDLLNEPEGRTGSTGDVQFILYDRIYEAIRAEDPTRMIIMESVWEPLNLPSPEDYDWENVVYEYHHYNWTDSNTSNSSFYTMKQLGEAIANRGVPVLIGEFNAWGDAGRTTGKADQTDEQAYSGVLEFYTGKGWHWTTWTYKVHLTSGNWGLYLLNASAETAKVNPSADTEEEIRTKWAACRTDTSYTVNMSHADTVSEFAKAEFGVAPPQYSIL